MAGFRLISPIDTPNRCMRRLVRSSLVLTESLHGAIFADTMGIAGFPFVTTRNVSALKWVDWCLSVGVSFAPVPLPPPSRRRHADLRPAGRGTGDAPLRFDAEAAMTEFRQRVAMHGAEPMAPGLAARARAGLREAARRSPGRVVPGLWAGADRRAAGRCGAAATNVERHITPCRPAIGHAGATMGFRATCNGWKRRAGRGWTWRRRNNELCFATGAAWCRGTRRGVVSLAAVRGEVPAWRYRSCRRASRSAGRALICSSC